MQLHKSHQAHQTRIDVCSPIASASWHPLTQMRACKGVSAEKSWKKFPRAPPNLNHVNLGMDFVSKIAKWLEYACKCKIEYSK